MPTPGNTMLTTERLVLRELTEHDDAFVLALLNEPLWIRFIGDRGVRTLEDARNYLARGPLPSYTRHGFGLWAVTLKTSPSAPIGMCGLIKRDTLPDVDVGFAFLEKFFGHGYATEAARATLHYGWERVGLKRIVAITDSANAASIHVLEKIGLRYEGPIPLPPDGQIGNLYAIAAPSTSMTR